MLVKTIHYYWHILSYEMKNDNPTELSLLALFENFPLNIDMSNILTQEPPTSSYYHHPTNTLSLAQSTLDDLHAKNGALKSIFEERYQTYQKSVTKIKAVWEEFNIPILERPIIPMHLSSEDMLTVSSSK